VGKGSKELRGHARSEQEARRGIVRPAEGRKGGGVGDGVRLGEAWGGGQRPRTGPGGSGRGTEGSRGGAEEERRGSGGRAEGKQRD